MEELRTTLREFCAETPGTPSKFSFEQMYSQVYRLCIQKEYAKVHSSLKEAVGEIWGTEHAQWHLQRLNDIALFYNNTCVNKAFETLTTIYQNYHHQFDTPPSTP